MAATNCIRPVTEGFKSFKTFSSEVWWCVGSSHIDQTCSKLLEMHQWLQLHRCSIQSPWWHCTVTHMLHLEPRSGFGPRMKIKINTGALYNFTSQLTILQQTNIKYTPYPCNLSTSHIISIKLYSGKPSHSVVCYVVEVTNVVGLHPGGNEIHLSSIVRLQPEEDLLLHHFHSTLHKTVGVLSLEDHWEDRRPTLHLSNTPVVIIKQNICPECSIRLEMVTAIRRIVSYNMLQI